MIWLLEWNWVWLVWTVLPGKEPIPTFKPFLFLIASFRYFTSGGNVGQTLLATDRTVISGIANTSEGLAYDWVSKNLYWVNTEKPASIDVVSNNGQFPSTKILKNLDKPRDLAVDPKEGYVLSVWKHSWTLKTICAGLIFQPGKEEGQFCWVRVLTWAQFHRAAQHKICLAWNFFLDNNRTTNQISKWFLG